MSSPPMPGLGESPSIPRDSSGSSDLVWMDSSETLLTPGEFRPAPVEMVETVFPSPTVVAKIPLNSSAQITMTLPYYGPQFRVQELRRVPPSIPSSFDEKEEARKRLRDRLREERRRRQKK